MHDDTTTGDTLPTLHVCITCRAGRTVEPWPGQILHGAIAAINLATPRIDLRTVACLSNCERPCSAAISTPGKWTYLLGHLTPEHAPDLLSYANTYAESAKGAVLLSKRPSSLRHVVMGRVPGVGMAA